MEDQTHQTLGKMGGKKNKLSSLLPWKKKKEKKKEKEKEKKIKKKKKKKRKENKKGKKITA